MSYKKLLQQVIGVTLVTLLLVGCGAPAATPMPPTPTPVPPTATPVPPTPTPIPPTATPVPPTPTPVPPTTPTPVPPTATPIPPTPTPVPPSPTPTPLPDLSNVVLTLEDLPSGFEAMPPVELGFTEEDLSQDGFTVESLFVFLEAEHFELVMGLTALVATRLEQAGFDVALRQPDFVLDSLIGGMGATDILEQKDLPDLDDIGDASVGVTVAADMEGIPMRMDIVPFRRDVVGAFILVMYIDGDVPIVPIGDVARMFDERIVEALSVTPTPLPSTPIPTPEPMGITITGVITNLEDAEQGYLAEDSYLQLVRVPADGQLRGTTDDQGRLAYDSELAQIPIPHDGVFTFQVESLKPGIYIIAAQLLRNSSFWTPLLVREAEYVKVEIPQDANLPLGFDLGEVTIPLP